ncbi:MAG: DUF1648 domain-containing protein [Oscillospiraceae bacterium]|jgi:uncharacterized membrane protein|nr:DUF1648 domain-containing protein [Oscillospiraceae bacterium]
MKELNLFCFICNIAVIVLCGALLPIIPKITRKSYLFGVKIPPSEQNCPEAVQMKRRYTAVCLIGTAFLLGLCTAQYLLYPGATLLTMMYFPFLVIPLQAAAFLPNWRKAVRLKEEKRWKVSNASFAETGSSYTRGTLKEMPWGWYLAGLAVILVSVAVALARYQSLPDIIPIHFDIHMVADGWGEKSLGLALAIPLVNVGMVALMWLCGAAFVKAKLQIDPLNPALSFAQHKLYRRRVGHCLGGLTIAMVITFLVIGLMLLWPETIGNALFWVLVFAPTIAATAVLVAVTLGAGQGGCKLKPKTVPQTASAAEPTLTEGRGDDKFWALGMFYYNPDNPAHLVEDRFGGNLGFNYARLRVKIGVALSLLALVGSYAWLTVWLISVI